MDTSSRSRFQACDPHRRGGRPRLGRHTQSTQFNECFSLDDHVNIPSHSPQVNHTAKPESLEQKRIFRVEESTQKQREHHDKPTALSARTTLFLRTKESSSFNSSPGAVIRILDKGNLRGKVQTHSSLWKSWQQ